MDFSNKSNITTISSGKNKTITWGSKSTINFGSEYTINSGSIFRNTVGTIIDFSGGNELLWSTGTVMKYELKDVYRYHLRGISSVGRNTAMKHQNYFYATAGFDPDMADETKKYFSMVENSTYRYKIVNYVLKVMNLTYKVTELIDTADSASQLVIKHPTATWTESTREFLQARTQAVVFSLDKVKTIVTFMEGWHFKLGFWKNFLRKDFHPNALAQISSTKGVFLGAQYENLAEEGTRTTAALYLDNTIRLRASSTKAQKASNVFYPRDVQPQGSMKPQDWISPEKIATEIKARYGKEPTEYAEFNGFKVPVDSSVDIGPASIDSYSNAITSHALNHEQKSVTKAALEYKIAKSMADEVQIKYDIAQKQLMAIKGEASENISALTAAEMTMAPLVAAAKVADKTQKAFLLAEATKLLSDLSVEKIAADQVAQQKKLSADASKGFSELKTSAEFFELSTESQESKVSIQGKDDALNLTTNKSELHLSEGLIYFMIDEAGLCASKDELELLAGDSGLKLSNDSVTLTGGGSEIKLANNSVTIGDLKITQVNANTKLNLLEKSENEIKGLTSRFAELEASFRTSIENKDKEIEALRQQIASLAQPKKKKGRGSK